MRMVIVRTSIIGILSILFSICSNQNILAAKHTVTGVIYDAFEGTPIPYSSVQVKGALIVVLADENGKYSIKVPSDNSVLQFTCPGFYDVEEKVAGRSVIDVKMTYEIAELSAVTVYDASSLRKNRLKGRSDKSSNFAYATSAQYEEISYNNLDFIIEEYGAFAENKFQLAKNVPLSTFSIDVDAASYSNVRHYINQGQIPPKNVVRSEELINYFNYNYPQPSGKHPINIITEISDCPWNAQNRLLHIGIKAKDIPVEELPGSNLVFLIDVSGSMRSDNKLPLLKSSIKMLVKQLRSVDKVAIVTYAGTAGITLESTNDKDKINNAIDKLVASGSTAGGAGIKLAYKIAKDNFIENGNNRIILATDGDFNVGVSSSIELEQLIEEERKTGVFLTVLGYGTGNYKDNKMQILAQKGNGNHAYIDNLVEAKKVLVSEFAGTLFTIAKDVKLQLEFNPAKVQAYRLIGYESRLLNKEDFNDDTKDAGEMGAGHTVTALYEIIPVGVNSNLITSVDELKYQKMPDVATTLLGTSHESLTIKVRYKAIGSEVSERIEIPVIDYKFPLVTASNNFKFSAAVAQVGMLLHDSPYKFDAKYKNIISLAKSAYGEDKEGYRHEFVKLVENLQLMSESIKK